MNTTNQNNTAAPSVTIAPRNPAQGVLSFVATLTTHKDVRSYPCRSMEECDQAGRAFHRRRHQARPKPAPEAETNPHQYDGPPRTAEQVAA